jgi:DNA-binding response OmpR family regulator
MAETDTATLPTVLVVEDDDNIGQLLQFMLERSGYAPVLLTNGREAADFIAREAPPALALFDVMLPYRDGFELVSLARAREAWQEVPVLMLSAKSQERDIVRALEAGANDYVLKPFQPQELLARIRRLVRQGA